MKKLIGLNTLWILIIIELVLLVFVVCGYERVRLVFVGVAILTTAILFFTSLWATIAGYQHVYIYDSVITMVAICADGFIKACATAYISGYEFHMYGDVQVFGNSMLIIMVCMVITALIHFVRNDSGKL